MEKFKILHAIQEIFIDILDNKNIILSEHSSPETIEGWDSIANVNIIISVESEFGIKFGIDDIQRVKKVGDIVEAVQKILRA